MALPPASTLLLYVVGYALLMAGLALIAAMLGLRTGWIAFFVLVMVLVGGLNLLRVRGR